MHAIFLPGMLRLKMYHVSGQRILKESETISKQKYTVYGKKSFLSKESDIEILQSIYFAYDVGIISFYSSRINKNAEEVSNSL